MARQRTNDSHLEQELAVDFAESDVDQSSDCVRRAVARLSTSQREVIHLHYFGDLSYEEIAEALGITRQAVHGRLQRARRRIAQVLGQLDETGAK